MMQYLDRFYFYLSRHSLRDWLYTLFTGICIFFCMELSLGLSMQQELAEHVIRFHVTAAGNSEEEQALKRHVYDRVFEKLQVFLEGVSSPQEAGERIHENLALVTEWAKEAVKNVGAQEEVQASWRPFPQESAEEQRFRPATMQRCASSWDREKGIIGGVYCFRIRRREDCQKKRHGSWRRSRRKR